MTEPEPTIPTDPRGEEARARMAELQRTCTHPETMRECGNISWRCQSCGYVKEYY